jgi:hypothetical protein
MHPQRPHTTSPLRARLTLTTLCLTALTTLCLTALTPAQQASALPFVDLGPSIGKGFGVYMGDGKRDTSYVGGGVAARLDLMIVQVEAQLNYISADVTGDQKTEASFFSLPVMARLDLSPVPMLKLAVGLGIEHRTLLKQSGAKLFADSAQLLPISASADISIPLLGTLGLEARFSPMLSEPAPSVARTHDFMLFGHFLF